MAQAGVIFDLDGVLIDSEGLYYRAYSEVLEAYGITISREEYEDHWIATGTGPEYIVAKHGLSVSPQELRQLRSPVYVKLLEQEGRLMPHVEQTLAWIDRVKPRRAYFTHMSHRLDYATLASQLPPGVAPAHDGLVIDLPG